MGQALATRATEHDLIAVGVFAHGEVRGLAVFGLGFAGAFAARGDHFARTDYDIGDLKG